MPELPSASELQKGNIIDALPVGYPYELVITEDTRW